MQVTANPPATLIVSSWSGQVMGLADGTKSSEGILSYESFVVVMFWFLGEEETEKEKP